MTLVSSSNVKREFIYLILLGLVLVTATLGYRINSVSIILMALFYVSDKNLIAKVKTIPFKVFYFYLGYFVLHLLGLLYTENIDKGSQEVTVKLAFLILPLVIFTEKVSKDNLNQLFVFFKYWLISIGVFLIYHKLVVIGGPLFTLPSISLARLIGVHHSYYSLFYIFTLFFLFHQVNTKRIGVIIGFVQILFFIFFIALLGARVIFIMAILFAILFFLKRIANEKGSKRILFLGVFLVSVFMVIQSTNVPEKFSRLTKVEWNLDKNIYNHQVFTFGYDEKTSNTLEMRLIKWYCSLEIIKKQPILGVGTGDYQDELFKKYHEIDFKKGMVYNYNTHNQFIEEFLKFGIVGGIFFILFFVFIIYQSIKLKNELLLYSTLTFCAFLFIESAFERQHGVLFFTLFITLAYVYNPRILNQSERD